MRKILWKSILSGFLYELFYQLALAMRWLTVKELFSFLAAGFIGIVIAIIIWQENVKGVLTATLGGILTAFLFHIIALYFNIGMVILLYVDPFLKEIGHTTANENITIAFVTFGYLFFSLATFLVTVCILSIIPNKTKNKE